MTARESPIAKSSSNVYVMDTFAPLEKNVTNDDILRVEIPHVCLRYGKTSSCEWNVSLLVRGYEYESSVLVAVR